MTAYDEILDEIRARLPEALTLTVGRMGKEGIEARHLALNRDAADSLRKQCKLVRDRLSEQEPVSYAAMAELNMGECFVIDDNETLAELGDFRQLAADLGAIQQITPNELDLTIKFYGVALGDDSN